MHNFSLVLFGFSQDSKIVAKNEFLPSNASSTDKMEHLLDHSSATKPAKDSIVEVRWKGFWADP